MKQGLASHPLDALQSQPQRATERPRRPPAWVATRCALDAVDVSAGQREWIRCILQRAAADERVPREEVRRLRLQLANIPPAMASTSDPALIEHLRRVLAQLKHAASERRTRALQDAVAVLTSEQQGNLNLRFIREQERVRRQQAGREPSAGAQAAAFG